MNPHEIFIHSHQGCFAGTGAIVKLPQCQWSRPDGYGKISQCITTTKHSKAKIVCIFLGIYCTTYCPFRTAIRPTFSWKCYATLLQNELYGFFSRYIYKPSKNGRSHNFIMGQKTVKTDNTDCIQDKPFYTGILLHPKVCKMYRVYCLNDIWTNGKLNSRSLLLWKEYCCTIDYLTSEYKLSNMFKLAANYRNSRNSTWHSKQNLHQWFIRKG